MKFSVPIKGSQAWSYWLSLISVYLITLSFRGFLFASNDVVDVMAYSLFLRDDSLFPFDFYIQNISASIPNERIVFAGLIALMGDSVHWLSFVLHFLSGLFLFAGIYKIASLFIQTEGLRWFVVLLLTGPLYGYGPGDCELYYNMFISSFLAKSIGVWALYFVLTGKFDRSYYLLIFVTLIHPTVGAQLFLLTFGTSLWTGYKNKTLPGARAFVWYLLTAGIWIAWLEYHLFRARLPEGISLWEIFGFRLAHHFLPSYFDLADWIPGIILTGISGYYFVRKNHENATLITGWILLGMMLYTLFTEVYPIGLFLSTQWFKTYSWLELIGVVAFIAILEKWIGSWPVFLTVKKLIPGLWWLLALVFTVAIHIPGNYLSAKEHEFLYLNKGNAEKDMALKTREHTRDDALIIVPMEFTGFKYYSRRSLYIDYKSVVHRKDALGEWYKRIGEIYGLGMDNRRAEENLYETGVRNYKALGVADFERFKSMGITHIVMYSDRSLPLPLITANEQYRLYSLADW